MSNKPVVVALGGNALDGVMQDPTSDVLRDACRALARVSPSGLVVTHGNGPQIGLLAEPRRDNESPTLDIVGAQTEGWLGYEIEQQLSSSLGSDKPVATLLTRVEVDLTADGSLEPCKPIGRWISASKAKALRRDLDWKFVERNGKYRRLVPSPRPIRCLQTQAIATLLQGNHIVICAGGGGIPVCRAEDNSYHGVEAVIDKDLASALIARQLDAQLLVLATNVAGIFENWPLADNDDEAQPISQIKADELLTMRFESGSMAPKAQAAAEFTARTGNPSVIGSLRQLEQLLQQRSGTVVV